MPLAMPTWLVQQAAEAMAATGVDPSTFAWMGHSNNPFDRAVYRRFLILKQQRQKWL